VTTLTEQTEKRPLSPTSGNGRIFSWKNPDSTLPIVVSRLIVDITSASAAASTCDFGSVPSNDASSDNLIDGLPTNVVGTFDNITKKGANGRTCLVLQPNEWITGTQASGNVAGLQGFAYITYSRS